ncbi:MAG: 30S ribosomal protein S2 [Candidatus Ranarchaeia archaeon]
MESSSDLDLLIELDKYLAAGVHIGTQVKTKNMEPFIYRIRSDGLYVLDVRKTDQRIRTAAKFLARFEPERICGISVRQYGQRPVDQFCRAIRGKSLSGRFIPGTFTNPSLEKYYEPDVVFLTDPRADQQGLKEAKTARLPTVSLCDTDSSTTDVDLVIPTNNKGRRALSLVYWLLAREVLRERGEITATDDISITINDFEARIRKVQPALE